jgi:hypothetical protein
MLIADIGLIPNSFTCSEADAYFVTRNRPIASTSNPDA